MIRTLLVGTARSLFIVACLLAAASAFCVYGSYRLLRAGFARSNETPDMREAGFAVLGAAVILGKALKARIPPPEREELDPDDPDR